MRGKCCLHLKRAGSPQQGWCGLASGASPPIPNRLRSETGIKAWGSSTAHETIPFAIPPLASTPSDTPILTANDALRRGTEFLRSLGIDAARLETELILAESMGLDRLGLYLNLQRPLTQPEREKSRAMMARRREREPLAYILGHKEFYGLRFAVTPAVLIPRPETEFLVERVLALLTDPEIRPDAPILADIGTGSGAIAVACAAHQLKGDLPGEWIATDVSVAALEIAKANAAAHKVEGRISFREGDLLSAFESPVDFLCSNPPYVPEKDRESLAREVARWEPAGALFSGADGLDHLHRLIHDAPSWINPRGFILLEIGFGQQDAVETALQFAGFESIWFHKDLRGIPRIAEARRPG